jgi:hypothetical protein
VRDLEVDAVERETRGGAVAHADVLEDDGAVDGPVVEGARLGLEVLLVLDGDALQLLPLDAGCAARGG